MRRKLRLESLETRCLMASLPFGAAPEDTGEFMLGRVAVTPVFVESSGILDPSTEDWTPTHKAEVLQKIESGLDWWRQLLATKTSRHSLEFVIDRAFADQPFVSLYEPINRRSNDYQLFVNEFLVNRGFNQSAELETNMRAFNHAQRQRLQTDWSFTIFVVNSLNDGDGTFATGGNFSRAFSFAGGLFEVVPSTRPASTFAHETGHMFWARDEYVGGGTYYQRRGYYNTQNTNALDLNPASPFQQADSIMSEGASLDRAFSQIVSADSTLAQIGWLDSDGDGIFDVLDVPFSLDGSGRLDTLKNEYVFRGNARVQTLPNQNSSGTQNNITLNQIQRIEYRLNNGNWTTLLSPNAYTVELDLRIPVPTGTLGKLELRAIDGRTGITSNIFSGSLSPAWSTTETDGVFGFAWNDQDNDGVWDTLESGVSNATVRLETTAGTAGRSQTLVKPSDFPDGQITGSLRGITLSSIGMDADGRIGSFPDSDAVLDSRVFRPYSWRSQAVRESFRGTDTQLKAATATPTRYAFVHVIGAQNGAIARLDAFDASGKLLGRAESTPLNLDQSQGLELFVNSDSIAYVIAYGHRDTTIKIDQVRFGLPAEVTTQLDGSYVFPGVPASTFNIRISPPTASYENTSPNPGIVAITVPANGVLRTDFGLKLLVSPWQNQSRRHDTNNDGLVDLFDVLIVINEINRTGSRALNANDAVPPPFLDVDGNRILDPIDALVIINFINGQGAGGEGESRDEAQANESASSSFDLDDWTTRNRRRRVS
ncbi:MAG: dockerin type I domain-containing protein [Planctomycetota bacterium]